MSEPELVLAGVSRIYPAGGRGAAHAAVSDLDLTVQRGEIVALIGPSGCGKSSTLRMVAGLDDPDRGTIHIGGRSMHGVAPQERNVAMVFQSYALYPQMTVRQILEFPLRMRSATRDERASAVNEASAMLSLGKLLERRPDQLSGGERQRVAMGRAIVRKPRVFLFDEPLANLDPSLREDIRLEIGTLVRRLGATALYVTHDHAEAMTLADRVAVMRDGRLLQCAAPREIYERPATEFVGTFVGAPRMNVLAAVREAGVYRAGPFSVTAGSSGSAERVTLGVRPEDVRVGGTEGPEAVVLAVEPLGAESHLVLDAGGTTLRVRQPGFTAIARGERVRVSLDASRLHFFDPARSGERVEIPLGVGA